MGPLCKVFIKRLVEKLSNNKNEDKRIMKNHGQYNSRNSSPADSAWVRLDPEVEERLKNWRGQNFVFENLNIAPTRLFGSRNF